MNWLHACWGLGAWLVNYYEFYVVSLNGYQDGYIIVALIQLSWHLFLTTLKMWKKND